MPMTYCKEPPGEYVRQSQFSNWIIGALGSLIFATLVWNVSRLDDVYDQVSRLSIQMATTASDVVTAKKDISSLQNQEDADRNAIDLNISNIASVGQQADDNTEAIKTLIAQKAK